MRHHGLEQLNFIGRGLSEKFSSALSETSDPWLKISCLGTVHQEWSLCDPLFTIKDHLGNPVLKIKGPMCGCECCTDVDFNVTSAVNGSEVIVNQ